MLNRIPFFNFFDRDTVPSGVDLVGKQVNWVQPAQDFPQFEHRCDGRVVATTWHAPESRHTTTVLAVTASRQMILGTPEGDLITGGTVAAYFTRDDAVPEIKEAIEAAGIKPDQKILLIRAANLR